MGTVKGFENLELADKIGKQIGGFIKYLQQLEYKGNTFKNSSSK